MERVHRPGQDVVIILRALDFPGTSLPYAATDLAGEIDYNKIMVVKLVFKSRAAARDASSNQLGLGRGR